MLDSVCKNCGSMERKPPASSSLPNKKSGSLRQVDSLARKREVGLPLERYNEVIKDQLEKGTVERVDEIPKGQQSYINSSPTGCEGIGRMHEIKNRVRRVCSCE